MVSAMQNLIEFLPRGSASPILKGHEGSHEYNGNPSPGRPGGVGQADCFNRPLTVAARYRTFMLMAPSQAAWATPIKSNLLLPSNAHQSLSKEC